ncbi:hypothetical protein [Halothiobacillus sp.]|uniref:hypothetical protein n=1 Tax=Halothiobacillus sp. TaxID=1891311 RepID=UPI0026344A03|nr:hypothetical protein [Halothiobacillus sp.]
MSFANKMRSILTKPPVACVATAAVATQPVNVRGTPVAEVATVAIAKGQAPENIRQMIQSIAPNATDELVYWIWRDAFSPKTEGSYSERLSHVEWWADLAKNHPETVYLAITSPPEYLKYLDKKTSKNFPRDD